MLCFIVKRILSWEFISGFSNEISEKAQNEIEKKTADKIFFKFFTWPSPRSEPESKDRGQGRQVFVQEQQRVLPCLPPVFLQDF